MERQSNGVQQHHIRVTRTARYATLGPLDRPVSEVWFVFHGYGQLARDFLRPFQAVDDGTRLIVAPEGQSRFYVESHASGTGPPAVGASWMTRDDRERDIADYIHYLDSVYREVVERSATPATSIHLLGFSQGAATASRWAVMGAARAERLILWAGALPPDLDGEDAAIRLGALRLVAVIGDGDPWATPSAVAEHEAQLQRFNIKPEIITFDGGHRLSKTVLRDLAMYG